MNVCIFLVWEGSEIKVCRGKIWVLGPHICCVCMWEMLMGSFQLTSLICTFGDGWELYMCLRVGVCISSDPGDIGSCMYILVVVPVSFRVMDVTFL